MLGKPVPSHVYDAIDTHIANKQFQYAWNAIVDAINAYQDPKMYVYNCLWLYQKGALVAARADNMHDMAIGMADKFITMGQKLRNMGTHVQEVELRGAQIRPPRQDEIDQMTIVLAQMEQEYRQRQAAQGKSVEAINADVSRFKGALAKTSGGCFTLVVSGIVPVVLLLTACGLLS